MRGGRNMEDKLTKQIRWCFRIKDGLKIVKPSNEISKSYLNLAKTSLQRAEEMLKNKDLLWGTIIIYYSEYYALYSFLQKIGVKCENHACSILAGQFLLGEEKLKTINEHKDRRIDAQYYLKTQDEKTLDEMLKGAKTFVAEFDNIVSNLTDEETKSFKSKLSFTQKSETKTK